MNNRVKVICALVLSLLVLIIALCGCVKKEIGNSIEISYEINCALDDTAKIMYVTTNVTVCNDSSVAIAEIPFYSYGNAYAQDGGKVVISNVKDSNKDVEYEVDGINGVVKLNTPLLSGENETLTISSRVSLPKGKKRLGYGDGYYNLHAFFPRVAFFDGEEFQIVPYSKVGDPYYFSEDDFVVKIEYPAKYVLAHSGERISDEINGENVSSVFKINDSRDVACWIGKANSVYEKEMDGIKIRSYQNNNTDYTEFIFNCISYFSAEIGAYPFDTFTLVETAFDYGGMEYSSFVVVSDKVKNKEFVIAHEIIHQWFGLKVGSNSYDECWVDESLTNYLTYYYMDIYNKGGLKENLEQEQEKYKKYVEYAKYEYGLGYKLNLCNKLDEFKDETEYANLVYGYGALMYDSVRVVLGEEKFKKAVREYYEEYAGKVAGGSDLIASFNKSSGRKVKAVFSSYMENRASF